MANTRSDIFLASWRPYLWIVLAGALLYSKTLFYTFSCLDDHILIFQRYQFLSDLSNILQAFKERVFLDSLLPYYRPVLMISFILDAQIGGLDLFAYHVTNIAIHLAAASLVFALLTKMGYRRAVSLFFSLVFTVHPLLTQAVAWIPGRNDSLMAAFLLASFITCLDFLKTGGRSYYLAHMVFLALAVLTKESAFILIPLVFIYIILIYKKRIGRADMAALVLGYAFIFTGWYFLRQGAVLDSVNMTIIEMSRYVVMYLPAVVQFIGKALLPFNLSTFPIMQDTTLAYGSAAIVLILLALVLSKRKRYNYVLFGALWMISFLLPSLIRPHAGIINDVLQHRFYISMVGFIIILMEIDFFREGRRKTARTVCSVTVLVLLSAITFRHSDVFRNRFTFWINAVTNSPHSSYAHLALGSIYYMDGYVDVAEREFRKSLELDRWIMRSHYFLGLIYMAKNNFKDAEREFRKEAAMHPYYDGAFQSLGAVYYKEGRLKEAEGAWKKALVLNPNNVGVMKNLAIYYSERGNTARSVYYVERLKEKSILPPPEFLKGLGIG